MEVIVSERAKKQLKKITRLKQIIMVSRLQSLARTEGSSGEEKLSGYSDMYRIRVGDYRIVFKKTRDEIHVVLIGHRREVYKLLERLLG